MNANEHRMLEILIEGRERFHFAAVKAEFEAEGTRTDELLRLLEIARRADVKVGLKIGGCEAVRDLIECKQFGVDYIIAPMVETPYALSKYIEAKNKIYPAYEREQVRFLFNIETISAFQQLEELSKVAASADGADGIVFGRVDFAGSLGIGRATIDTDDVTGYVLKTAEAARSAGLDLVMGGGVNPASIPAMKKIRAIRLDRFETRKIIFQADILDGDTTEDALALAIEFELLWLKNKRDYYSFIGREDDQRIEMLEARFSTIAPARAVA
jgi:hypothetical protein